MDMGFTRWEVGAETYKGLLTGWLESRGDFCGGVFAVKALENPLGVRYERRETFSTGLSARVGGTVAILESDCVDGVGVGLGGVQDLAFGEVDGEEGFDLGGAATKEGETTKRT